jgi:ElaB/YqjD/DUF883 family membrane-anchored ribosome-binding protein
VVDENRDRGEDARGGARSRGDGHEYRNRIFEHTAEAKEEAQMLASSLGELTQDVSSYVEEQVKQRPWAVLGVAAAIGYVIGGGLPSRITRAGVSIAMRMGSGMLVNQLMERHGASFMGGGSRGESMVEGDTGV